MTMTDDIRITNHMGIPVTETICESKNKKTLNGNVLQIKYILA